MRPIGIRSCWSRLCNRSNRMFLRIANPMKSGRSRSTVHTPEPVGPERLLWTWNCTLNDCYLDWSAASKQQLLYAGNGHLILDRVPGIEKLSWERILIAVVIQSEPSLHAYPSQRFSGDRFWPQSTVVEWQVKNVVCLTSNAFKFLTEHSVSR